MGRRWEGWARVEGEGEARIQNAWGLLQQVRCVCVSVGAAQQASAALESKQAALRAGCCWALMRTAPPPVPAWPLAQVAGNPCLAYVQHIVLPWCEAFEVERAEQNGGNKCAACGGCRTARYDGGARSHMPSPPPYPRHQAATRAPLIHRPHLLFSPQVLHFVRGAVRRL